MKPTAAKAPPDGGYGRCMKSGGDIKAEQGGALRAVEGLLKRGIVGTLHKMSAKDMPLYR